MMGTFSKLINKTKPLLTLVWFSLAESGPFTLFHTIFHRGDEAFN